MTRLDDPMPLGKVVTEVADQSAFDETTNRYLVQRTGEREPIPRMLRLLVWLRDQGLCHFCRQGRRRDLMELDHIVPWSAGGPDRASNLRVACQPCNTARSNFGEWGGPRLKPKVTPMCDRCAEQHDGRHSPWWHKRHSLISSRYEPCPLCPLCGVGDEFPIDEFLPPEIAWCGQCESLSAVTGRGRVL